MKVICDIEANGLTPDKIWCCVCKDIDTGDVTIFRDGDADKAREFFNQCEKVIGHNIIGYDAIWLNKLWKIGLKLDKIIDTLVLSRLANSFRAGHSLRDWGENLGVYKDHHDDWSQWSQEMEDYCVQDVEVTEAVYNQLKKELRGCSKDAVDLEHWSQAVLEQQRMKGFKLDVDLALTTKAAIDREYLEIIGKLQQVFPPRKVITGEWTAKRTKDGDINKVSRRIIGSGCVEHIEGDRFYKVEYKEFCIDSPSEIVARLEGYWKPFIMTPGGAPKVCEENLNTLKEDAPPELQLIKRCKVLKSRSTLIQSYLDACGDDGRVHGQVVSIGAGTHRMAHRNPNSGNIPSKGIYGEVCRQMFTVCPGRKLVGCDAANIQFRILAHYLKNDELIDQIVNKDMHYYFSQMYGLNPKDREYDASDHDLVNGRKKGKTCTFAIIMGAGVGKIGQILGSAEKGREAFDNLKKNIKGWTKFHKEIEYRAGLGYFIGLDGRRVPLKSAHFGMSSYLQAGEAIIMKRAMVESFKEIKKKGLDAFQVAVVHDEMQYDCAEDCAEEVGSILRRHIIEAGEYYKLCCPLDGEYVIGKNWLETH
jgi:DNA polymerase-1